MGGGAFPCIKTESLVVMMNKCCGRVFSGCKRLVKCSSEKGGKRERGDQSVTDCEQSIEIPHYFRTSRYQATTSGIFIALLKSHLCSYGYSGSFFFRCPGIRVSIHDSVMKATVAKTRL